MEKGIPAGNVAYGYKVVLDENKVRVVVEDKEAADVVRWIFNEAEKGVLQSVIAEKLNAEHILTPSQYRVRNNKEKLEKLSGVKWTVDTLSQILKNEVYIGKYVTGKDRVCLYRHEKRHMTSKDEWNVFEDHHTPLVTKEQFYAVQKNKRKALKPAKKQTVNMLKGKITCGCCGSSIHIHPEKHAKVYMCTHRKRYGKDSCNCLPVKVDDVYAAVLAVIKEQIQVFTDKESLLKEHHRDSRIVRQEQIYMEAVNKCVKEMDRLMELKGGLYADYTEELLDEKEYLQLNREYAYFDELGFFGPAVEEAYGLESSYADVPMIALSPQLGKKFYEWEEAETSMEIVNLLMTSRPMLVEKESNKYFLNIFYQLEAFSTELVLENDSVELDEIKRNIYRVILRDKEKYKDKQAAKEERKATIYEKLDWFEKYLQTKHNRMNLDIISGAYSGVVTGD